MSDRAKDASLYTRARKKRVEGKKLTYEERQRLALARDRRVAREEATARRDHNRSLSEKGDLRLSPTKYGWRVIIPEDHPGGPWSTGSEIEVVTLSSKVMWVTLVRLYFTGSDIRHCQWWSYSHGRKSEVQKFEAPPLAVPNLPPPEEKQLPSALDEEDMELVSTGAGAAYLAARRRRNKT